MLKSLLLVDLLEDVFEATVILLQDGVLGAEVQRPGFGQSHLEGAVCKVPDRLICIVHPHSDTTCAWTDTKIYIKYNTFTYAVQHHHIQMNILYICVAVFIILICSKV